MQLKNYIQFDNPKFPLKKYILAAVAIVLLLVFALRVQNSRVDKNVLNSFVVLDEGLVKSIASIIAKTETKYMQLEAEFEICPDKVIVFYKMAHRVRELSNLLHYDIQELKVEIVRACDGKYAPSLSPFEWYEEGEKRTTFDIDANLIMAKGNTVIPTHLILNNGRGKELKEKIENFKTFGYNFYDTSLEKYITNTLNTDFPPTSETWASYHFGHSPMIAVIVGLSKIQNDIRNVEAEIVQYLLSAIGATDFRVNRMEAVVQAKSRYVTKGDDFEARILLAAYDSLQKPEILIGPIHRTKTGNFELVGEGKLLPYNARGHAIYKVSTTTVGNFTLQGIMRINMPLWGVVNFPFSYEYMVGEVKIP